MLTDDKVEEQGAMAAALHRPESDCPYHSHSREWEVWHRGYYVALEFEVGVRVAGRGP